MTSSDRFRRARRRLLGTWRPGLLHAERRCVGLPSWWIPEIFGSTEWCEATDETAEYFSALGALLADGSVPDALIAGLLLQQQELRVGLAVAAAPEPERNMLEAALYAWELWPGRTETQVLQLFDRAIARASALERKGNQ